MKKFLQTFASQTGQLTFINPSINGANFAACEWILTSALAAAGTLTLKVPAEMLKGLEKPVSGTTTRTWVPVKATAMTPAAPQLKVVEADLLITSFNPLTGEVILTAANGGVADASTVVVLFTIASLKTP